MKQTADEYYYLLVQNLDFDEYKEPHRESIHTKYGKAISSFEAAHCIKEFFRTRQFICGLFEAIKDMQSKHPDEIIRILYAGTGPFGALMLPMTTLFSAKEIQFTAIEINPISMNFLKNTVERFGVSDYIDEYLLADATRHQLKNKGTQHILLTETMQQSLQNEPQVAISLNLVPQLSLDAILIPKSICVDLVLMNIKNNHRRKMGEPVSQIYRPLTEVLKFNQEKIANILSNSDYFCSYRSFYCTTADVPAYTDEESLCLLTNIQIYGNYHLKLDECSLNLPTKIKEDHNLSCRHHQLTFDYVISEKPCFKWKESRNCDQS